MKTQISDFNKTKNFLVCIDSDGCAMDTMEVKHRKCFGPMAVEVWNLHAISETFLEVWYHVNLYSKTRGINRFKGLVKTFEDMESKGYEIPNFESIKKWTIESKELSNPALISTIEKNHDKQLEMALEWSKKVNESIEALANDDEPFPNVLEGLSSIYPFADIAIVSSANSKAVYEEWTRHSLNPYVEVMCGQEAGSKAYCIKSLKELGKYSDTNVLMVGDAPGDYAAAKENGVFFYPIIAGKEASSWEVLAKEALSRFLECTYEGSYQESLINMFNESLK